MKRILSAGLLLVAAQTGWAQETVRYVHTDALGSPVAYSNAAGVVTERIVYEPYGNALGAVSVDGPGFTGHVRDGATLLSYMQQRYMDPQLGMFLSMDPVTAYIVETNGISIVTGTQPPTRTDTPIQMAESSSSMAVKSSSGRLRLKSRS